MSASTQRLPRQARIYIGIVATLGILTLLQAAMNWDSPDLLKFGGFLAIALASSGMRINVPGLTGTLSLTFLFVLFGVIDLTTPETIVMASLVTLVQCLFGPSRGPRLAQTIFNVAAMAMASGATSWLYHTPLTAASQLEPAIRLGTATFALFMLNTCPVAAVISLAEGTPLASTWRQCYFWSFPYYLGGAAIAQVAAVANRYVGWQTVLLTGPVVYLIYRSYQLYLSRLENERKHAEAVSSLHLRTIEALALAIEAKDHTTHDHLARVQVYAREIAKDMGLSEDEQEALRAASVLHDIGKLAVPEHIISKPGRLSPEEFEKMKIHPIVGGEILERVQFPYPVVPIVRAHHEKWDGTGYPMGLKQEEIPVGARILAVVDCLDALASDRQYRRALPLDEAMKVVRSEAGKAFDPQIVELLGKRYVELESMAKSQSIPGAPSGKLSKDVKVERGHAPAAGFEAAATSNPGSKDGASDFLGAIAAARQEVQALFEISQELGNSLSLDETLSMLGVRLRHIVPHHSLAIWIKREAALRPENVNGDDFRLFSTLEIPVGQGLSGWVAENRKPIINGNPSVEPGYLGDPNKFSTLRSAIAVPLEGVSGVVGVLSLYHGDRDAFTRDHLRILLAISSKIALSIDNALRFRQAESSATTDYLTNLPNARSLFLHLDSEISRARRTGHPVSVMVLDLDGFKHVNDRFGHLEGNRVLRAVANGLKSICREYDYVARMGGDEFVVLLPGARPGDAESKIVQFRSVIAQVCDEMFSVNMLGVSIGIAHFPQDGTDAEQLLAEADRRMYTEKRLHEQERARPKYVDPSSAPEWAFTVQ